ncbi:MAG: DMT family transporter [Marinosulfonomonas sp.]|nr:DMT family transporter [Marinosulfonomonas sp.]
MNQNKSGWINGFIGVVIFSASLPATRVAVSGFDPVFLTVARAAIAGLLAAILLMFFRQKKPDRGDILSLIIVAFGVVVGFPLLTAMALQHITSAHSIIFIGLLPLSTALFGVFRAGESPQPTFWLFSVAGSGLVAGFALSQDISASWAGDILMFAAIVVCGLGYAEGAKLSRSLGGWQVICWALVLSLPIMAAFTFLRMPPTFSDVSLPSWFALGYVSSFSMLIGFVFWYRGLAQGGIAAVSQLQLLQPLMGLVLAATLLGEKVSWPMIAVSLAVVACVVGAKKFAH